MFRQYVKPAYSRTITNVIRIYKIRVLTTLTLAAFLASGCQREAITTYNVPKEDHSTHSHASAASEPLPHVHWELPKGWEERDPGQMSVGTFRVTGEDGKTADVRIVPLQGITQSPEVLDQILSLWRNELGLPTSTQPKTNEVEVAGLSGTSFDFTGAEPTKKRTTAALVSRRNVLWSFKFSGEESLVAAQQNAFREFLKSIEFHDEPHDDAPAAASAASTQSRWKAPEGWTEQPAGQMVLAAYSAKSSNGSATITVTSFPGDVGGLLANVNRWRRQIQLSDIQESELKNVTKEITLSDGSKATEVRLKGPSSTLLGLVVPRGDQTWFYKMTGDDATVTAEANRLTDFAAIAK